MKSTIMVLSIFISILCMPAFAAHPLITDDTGTQGTGRFSIEANGEYSNVNGDSETTLGATLSAGAIDNIDIVLSVPYVFLSAEDESGDSVNEDGLSDISLEVKWRFHEKDGFSFALKPGVTFATGDEEKGLGEGKPSYSLFVIATKELEKLTLHANLGYIRNREELRDIWHYSLAAEYPASVKLTIVGNIGGETNPERGSNVHPLFFLGGLIYTVTDDFDIDFGIKAGLNEAEADYTLLAGVTYGF